MNVAILIGVSEYTNGVSNLPGSKNDVVQFHKMLQKTKKFEDILLISEETESSKVKDKLTSFINGKKEKTIDELLFYFSGHGDFANNEFYYILSDFSFDKKTQTSLENSELDRLIKSISPSLVTKIVDACHSGINYIKDISAIDTYIKSTSTEFNNCYFMYSSLNSQSSFQNQEYSFFTLSFLNAIKLYNETDLRYKDIIDFISDEFTSIPEQTPFFVTQANFTELFCQKNSDLNSFLKNIPVTFPSVEIKDLDDNKGKSLEELVKLDEKFNLSLNEIDSLFEEMKKTVESFGLQEQIKNLFEFDLSFPKTISHHANFELVGQFVRSNDDYFAIPTYKTEVYEDIIKPSKWDVLTGGLEKPYTVTKEREVVDGYSLTANYPFKQMIVKLNAKHSNIDSYNCTIVFITSDRKIKLYYFITNYKKKNWTELQLNQRYQWSTEELMLSEKNSIKNFLFSINEKLNERIINDLKRKFENHLSD